MISEHSQSQSKALRVIRWPALLIVSVGLLLLVGISAGRETYQQWKVDQEIDGLQAQVQTLEGRRLQLLDTLQKLNSADELDKEARLRLDVKKPGERVIVLRGFKPETQEQAETSVSQVAQQDQSNPQKWFTYFFGK